MQLYDINGNTIFQNTQINARDIILSNEFQTYFPMYYTQFASPLGLQQTKGKYLYICGDSLHDYAGGNGTNTNGFVTTYNKYLGMVVTQDGYAGSTWSGTNTGNAIQRVKTLISNNKAYDVVILAYGTNSDSGGNGTISDNASENSTTLVGAMKYCIESLRTQFPKTAIGIILPPPSTNRGVSVMSEVAELMKSVCENYNVPYVDMRQFVNVSDLSDGTHLNASGSLHYGAGEADLIKRICPYGDSIYK